MNSITNGLSRQLLILKTVLASVLIIIGTVSCSSAPSETPEKFVLKFIQKHIPMIDRSVADFYVKEERAGVVANVQKFIASKKNAGNFESLKSATYDFSKIKVDVLDQKEEYVDDQAVDFVRVSATGTYSKNVNGTSESFIEDEIFILESIGGKWKVTGKVNPWK